MIHVQNEVERWFESTVVYIVSLVDGLDVSKVRDVMTMSLHEALVKHFNCIINFTILLYILYCITKKSISYEENNF
jgi:hypothetical protein